MFRALHSSHLLRVISVGAFCGWLALVIFDDTSDGSKTGLICVLLVSFFVATLGGCHPMDARLGFHPSYGYAFQLFTYTGQLSPIGPLHCFFCRSILCTCFLVPVPLSIYLALCSTFEDTCIQFYCWTSLSAHCACCTETIIVVEGFLGVGTRDGLVVSRLLGQLIGIAAAALVTQLLWPSWAHKDTRRLLAKSLRQSGKLLLTAHPEDSQPSLAIEAMLAESDALTADSDLFHEAPVQYFYRSLSEDEKLVRLSLCTSVWLLVSAHVWLAA